LVRSGPLVVVFGLGGLDFGTDHPLVARSSGKGEFVIVEPPQIDTEATDASGDDLAPT